MHGGHLHHSHHSSSHSHHPHSTPESSTRNLSIAFWLNFAFALVELVGGFYTQSFAVMSDALHDFGDAMSLGLAYFLQRKSAQGPSESYSYGLRRLSLLSAVVGGLVISTGAIYVGYQSLMAFLSSSHEPNGLGMMALAGLGIAVNGFAAWKLGHGHTHNEQMMKWHLLEDVFGWVAVLVGSLGIYFFRWTWLDSLLGLGLSLFVIWNVLKRLGESLRLFLQGNPNPVGLKKFEQGVRLIDGVIETHDVHFWSLDGVRHVLSLHVVLNDSLLTNLDQASALKHQIRELSQELGDCHLTIELESGADHCEDNCADTR